MNPEYDSELRCAAGIFQKSWEL